MKYQELKEQKMEAVNSIISKWGFVAFTEAEAYKKLEEKGQELTDYVLLGDSSVFIEKEHYKDYLTVVEDGNTAIREYTNTPDGAYDGVYYELANHEAIISSFGLSEALELTFINEDDKELMKKLANSINKAIDDYKADMQEMGY